MKKNFTKYVIIYLLVLQVWNVYGQCTNTTQYPSSTITAPTTTCVKTTFSSCNYYGEYGVVSCTASTNYQAEIADGGYVTVRIGSSSGTVLANGVSPLSFNSGANTTLYIHWNGNASCSTDSNCHTTTIQKLDAAGCVPPPPPANDNCTAAINLGHATGTTTVNGDCTSATNDSATPSGYGCATIGKTVWYYFDAVTGGNQSITASVCTTASSWDSEIGVFKETAAGSGCGTNLSNLTYVGCDDDGCSPLSTVTFTAANTFTGDPNSAQSRATIRYYIAVGAWSNTAVGAPFTLTVTPAANALPIKLKSFTGVVNGTVNTLNWVTSSEQNTQEFQIERSLNGKDHWVQVGKEVTAAGSSVEERGYTLNDDAPPASGYYRLLTMDLDGKIQKSDAVQIERKTDKFGIATAFPNPTSGLLSVQFETTRKENLELHVIDLMGRIVLSKVIESNGDIQSLDLDLSNIAAGVYTVSIANNSEISMRKIVKE